MIGLLAYFSFTAHAAIMTTSQVSCDQIDPPNSFDRLKINRTYDLTDCLNPTDDNEDCAKLLDEVYYFSGTAPTEEKVETKLKQKTNVILNKRGCIVATAWLEHLEVKIGSNEKSHAAIFACKERNNLCLE